jgi:type IV pilus assembly protein PilB
VEYDAPVEERAFVEKVLGEVPADAKFMKGAGCSFCRETGFFERVGVYEVLTVTDGIRRLMVEHAGQVEVRAMAVQEGMRPLSRQAVELAMAGTTTVSEIFRTVAVM